jgi:hypothetical protein
MSPEERELYEMHFFNLGDEVIVGESDVIGTITGMQVAEGQEDSYRVLYVDEAGSPHESWWRGSLLESIEPDDSNIVCLACERAAREGRNATKH